MDLAAILFPWKVTRRMFFTSRSDDDSLHGFLSHPHSSMVTMSQKSSVPQAAKFVSQALMPDTRKLSTAAARLFDALMTIMAYPTKVRSPESNDVDRAASSRARDEARRDH
jgi:hypothetical protein